MLELSTNQLIALKDNVLQEGKASLEIKYTDSAKMNCSYIIKNVN